MKKIEQIVREEQNSIGAQEMLMPKLFSHLKYGKKAVDTTIMVKKC